MGIPITKPKPKSKATVRRAIIPPKLQRAMKSKLSGAGVVKFCVQGSAASSSVINFTPSKLVAVLQVGLPFRELQALQPRLAMPSEKLAPMLGISKATFHRRNGDAGKLPPAVSDRGVR
jgi:uncharacterized protein (DUF2384 family)